MNPFEGNCKISICNLRGRIPPFACDARARNHHQWVFGRIADHGFTLRGPTSSLSFSYDNSNLAGYRR